MESNSYHHEGLKDEMIKKGLQLLNKEGYDGFSLRKLAALCNVSHTAPYRHFKNKDELISAIAVEIASEMKDAFMEATSKHDDPGIQFKELCKSYIRFMVEKPDYFRYVFMTNHNRPIIFTDTEIRHGENWPFEIGEKFAKAYFGKFHEPDAEWISDFLAVWSQIHGFTLLLVNRTIECKGDYLAFADRMLNNILTNWKQNGPA